MTFCFLIKNNIHLFEFCKRWLVALQVFNCVVSSLEANLTWRDLHRVARYSTFRWNRTARVLRVGVEELMGVPHSVLCIITIQNPCLRVDDVPKTESEEAVFLFKTSALFDFSNIMFCCIASRSRTVQLYWLISFHVFFGRPLHLEGESKWLRPLLVNIPHQCMMVFVACC